MKTNRVIHGIVFCPVDEICPEAKIASLQGATFGIQFKSPAAGNFFPVSPFSPLHAFLDISDPWVGAPTCYPSSRGFSLTWLLAFTANDFINAKGLAREKPLLAGHLPVYQDLRTWHHKPVKKLIRGIFQAQNKNNGTAL